MDVTVSQYRFYYRSLAIRMVLAIVVMAVVPLFTMAALTRYYFQASYREELQGRLKALVATQQQRIDSYLSERADALKILGRSIDAGRQTDAPYLDRSFRAFQETFGTGFLNVALLDSDGAQIACAGSCDLQIPAVARQRMLSEVSRRQVYVADVSATPTTVPHFLVAVRLDNGGQNRFLQMAVRADALDTLLRDLGPCGPGRWFIVNGEGVFQTPSLPVDESVKAACQGKDDGAGQPDGVVVTESASGSDLCVSAPIRHSGWTLVFVYDTQEGSRGMYEARTSFVLTLLLGLVAIVSVAIVVANRLARYVAQVDQEKQLINEQLVRAGQLASLGEMAAGVAHEINNPVAVMVEEAGWIQDLVEDGDESIAANLDEFKKSLRKIQTQGKRCRDITHKLLSFARRTEPILEHVQLNELLEDVVTLSEQKARLSNIEVQMELDPSLPTAHVSSSEVQQVLINVINNALDAMEQSGGIIRIATGVQGHYVVVDVADTGPGIPTTALGRIFEPFFTTKRVGKGTGLGLSICYGIMKKMKGDVTVNSEEGKGTTFHLFFPMDRQPVRHESVS